MDSSHDKKIMNVEADRLSSLPDDLIHVILSFIGIKPAIRTSVLSSRWRYIWTTMPYLDFSTEDFYTLPKFSKSVTHVLSSRNNLVEVSSVKLRFRGKASQVFVRRVMNYVFSHNVQRMTITCLQENDIDFPLSLFSSQSLKHLTLLKEPWGTYITPTLTWELPALTTLHLDRIRLFYDNTDNKCIDLFSKCANLTTLHLDRVKLFYDNADSKCIDLFSKCANLKNLTLKRCKIVGLNSWSICHPRLSNLTLDDWCGNAVNVVAPQLENLIIRNLEYPYHFREYVIFAPDLASLVYKSSVHLHLSTDGFHSLKEANICVSYANNEDAHRIVCLLQQLHSVKFLTLNLEIVELLSSSMELISHQPSPFANLKRLKIYPVKELTEQQEQKKMKMSSEVKNFLLENSPSATFTVISREEIRAAKNATTAQNLTTELRMLLDQEEADTEINMAHMEREKAPKESHNTKMHEQGEAQPEMQMKPQIGGSMAQIKSCWKDLSMQIEQRKDKACLIISKLQSIEGLLTKLPESKRDMIQTSFSSLCAEANIVINRITDRIKIQCDENQSRLSDCFRELATKLQPSL